MRTWDRKSYRVYQINVNRLSIKREMTACSMSWAQMDHAGAR
jgi:hypothetical protein